MTFTRPVLFLAVVASFAFYHLGDAISCYSDGWLTGASPKPAKVDNNCDYCTQALNQTKAGDIVGRGYICRLIVYYPDNTPRYEVSYLGGPMRYVYCNCNATNNCNGDANQCTPELPMPTPVPAPKPYEPNLGKTGQK